MTTVVEELHNTLAVYYRQFRGTTAPESGDVAVIWARVEREERVQQRAEGAPQREEGVQQCGKQ